MAEPRVLYDSEDTHVPVDGESVIVEGDQGEMVVLSSLIQKAAASYNPADLREIYGVAKRISEQAGEVPLGGLAEPKISDLTLNDTTIEDAKVVAIIAQHAEAISRHNIVITQLVKQINTFFAYAHNEKVLIPYTAPTVSSTQE
ncbi:hypothetical protein GA565_10885 [Rouxiella sp. S1S-2]|uniref:hypothetical protein n=1 Tax=Rouxiella sp. S1S-2 TaxID=2653856 RepID=UPI0012641B50|nr:hypothetical protein [Rouxiella sp. S1S-2]KAB7896448.1 hypothetical protein GA565_10885 [Rouxiella sp. S1S-2]